MERRRHVTQPASRGRLRKRHRRPQRPKHTPRALCRMSLAVQHGFLMVEEAMDIAARTGAQLAAQEGARPRVPPALPALAGERIVCGMCIVCGMRMACIPRCRSTHSASKPASPPCKCAGL